MARPPDAAHGAQACTLPSPSSPLLRLPAHVRQRIYRWLGLASWDGRRYRFNLHAGRLKLRHGRGELETRFVPDPSSFHGLLLSCRSIYAEAAALLYSANHFILYYFDPVVDPGHRNSHPPLYTLHSLTATSLRSLSSLKILLNEAACHQLTIHEDTDTCCVHGREEYLHSLGRAWCKQKHVGVHYPPLLSPTPDGSDDDSPESARAVQAVLSQWHSAAARLISHAVPGRLALALVCDINPKHPCALDIASSVVTPIRLLPWAHLKECHIRLAETPDRRLQQLTQDTVLHACGIPTPSQKPPPSPTITLTSLPPELRVKILEYTDLVTPSREVIWSRQDRAYAVLSRGHDQFFECWWDRPSGGEHPGNGCFCRRRHAAFSIACKCWAPPGPSLFLICRNLYEDAQLVFFSRNRFIVHDYKLFPPWVLPLLEQRKLSEDEPLPTYPYPFERFAVSEFLRDVVPASSLPHLRFLEMVFPPYRPPSWPETQHPAMQDWRALVDWLRDKVNLPGLTLRLMVAELDNAPASYYRSITDEEGGQIMTAYMDLLHPLTRLAEDGLSRFYAHLAYPWELTEESQRRSRETNESSWVYWEMEALKERAERYVMGQRYESLYANGREEPHESDWYVISYYQT